jgi:acetyl-CoA carboxylase biotin carboxyl carrier protein
MDPTLIKSLIDALAASDLGELEFTQDGASLRLVKTPGGGRTAPVLAMAETIAEPEVADVFRSPLYGVVHLHPSPGAPPFVQIGQSVQAGQTLCTVEAMKAFTELRAEADGVIDAILVETGQEVEASQILFRLGQ